jgi:hypothetical protein
MKLIQTFALIISATLIFTACSEDADDATVNLKENTNPLLTYVPVDTPYVFADLESVPVEITDVYIARFQPVLDVMSGHVEKFKSGYQAGEFQDNHVAQLGMAVLDELGGELSTENLENLGISLQAHHAVYGTGIFPVVRLGLMDEQKLRDAITRIEGKMGAELPVKNFNGTSYWRITDDETPVAIYIAILEEQLAVSAFPVGSEDRLLAAFLGQKMPANSMASSNTLGNMNHEKGYTGYGSGFVDIQKMADEIINPNSETRSMMSPEMITELDGLDAVCVAEIETMIAKTPRMTAGTTSLTTNEVSVRYDLEIENSLASGLAALVSNIPTASDGNFLLSASLAIKVGKLRSFVLEKATAIFESPYQCANLQKLNEQAGILMTQLNTPMPPMINNLMGMRVRVDDYDPNIAITDGDGLLALHVDKPEMFVGMASMMVPGFDSLDLANQSEPVKIPAEVMQMEGIDVYALMNESAIGAAIGEKHVKDLVAFMSAKGQDNGTLLSISHDMAKQAEIQNALSKQFPDDMANETPQVNEYAEAMQKAYADILDRSRVDVRFTGKGMHIDSKMTFK